MGMTTFVILCLSLFTLPYVLGTSYYFAASGNDAATTSSPTTPWQTITKLNSLTLKAGDSVLFNKGDTFRGQITFTKSGTATAPITFSSYGSASDLPTIKGTNVVSSGWTVYSGSIYQLSVTSTVTEVFVDGALMTLARFPNTGFLRSSSMSGWVLKTTDLTQPSGTWNGATVKIRNTNWSYDQSPVTSYTLSGSVASLTLSNHNMEVDFLQQPGGGWGFYLENQLAMLDAPGEWFYDSSAKILYLWMPNSASPNGANVEATVYNYGIYDNGSSKNFVVSNLRFSQQEIAGVYSYGGTNNLVSNCQFSYQNQHGVYFDTVTNGTVTNNIFSYINSHGITFDTVTASTVSYNLVNYIGLIAGKGLAGEGAVAGISLENGAQVSVLYNRVTQIGYLGIRFDGGRHHIEGNVVDWCMLTLDDGGGIYAYGTVSTGSLIKNNIVSNIYPNILSTPGYTQSLSAYGEAHCLYFDSYTNIVTVLNNTFYNCLTSAIYVHDSPGNVVKYNNLYNCSAQLSFFDQSDPGGLTNNNTIDHNYILAAQTGQMVIYEETAFSNTDSYATYTNNQYADPYTSKPFEAQPSTTGQDTTYTFTSWVNLKHDTTDTFGSFSSSVSTGIIVNPTNAPVSEGPLVNGVAHYDLRGNQYTFPIILPAYSSILVVLSGSGTTAATTTSTATTSTTTTTTTTHTTATTSTTSTSTSTSSSSGGTTGAPPAKGNLVVYNDSLQNGFEDWSWSTSYTFTSTTHVHSGTYSIQFALQNYEGIDFHAGTNFELGSYASFQFYFYSTSTFAATTIDVILYGSTGDQIGPSVTPSVSFPANTWTLVSIPVSKFTVSYTSVVSGISIQANTKPNIGNAWLDDVYFIAP